MPHLATIALESFPPPPHHPRWGLDVIMYNTTQIRRLGFWQAAAAECLLRLGTSRGKMPEIILHEIVAALNVSHSAALRLGKAPTLTRKYSGRGPDASGWWHSHNASLVRAWLGAQAPSPPSLPLTLSPGSATFF